MTFKINLTEQEVNLVLAGLGELPAKHSIDLILSIKTECESQSKTTEVETIDPE